MKKLLIAVALTVSTLVHASFMSGNDLVKLDKTTLSGYIAGVVDVERIQDKHVICIHKDVTLGQMTDLVQQYLKSTAQIRHYS